MRRSYILSAASAIALTTGLAGSPAMAFDKVDWDWELDLKVELEIDEKIDLDVDPKGATIVEVEQDFKGDLTAKAFADDIKIEDVDDNVSVSNTAAALANAVIVTTETSAMLDIKQELEGDWWGGAELKAEAELKDVEIKDVDEDVDVSNVAQAIGNYVSLTVDPACDECDEVKVEELFAVVNVDQSAHMYGYAYASLDGVSIDDVGGDVSVANSAIAAGNLVSITVVRGAIPFPDQN